MGQSQRVICTYAGCGKAPTKRLRFLLQSINAEYTGNYCDDHAVVILALPGAREIVSEEAQ